MESLAVKLSSGSQWAVQVMVKSPGPNAICYFYQTHCWQCAWIQLNYLLLLHTRLLNVQFDLYITANIGTTKTVWCSVYISVLLVLIFRFLLALVLVPSPCWPPPLTCAVSILSNGRNDRNLKVSYCCEWESKTLRGRDCCMVYVHWLIWGTGNHTNCTSP